MDFPAKKCVRCAKPVGLADALGCELRYCGCNGVDYLVEVENENMLRGLKPNFSELVKLPVRGVIVTCASDLAEFNFVSRFFAPAAGINEDRVTGSAHCSLGPYWQSKLNNSDFTAYQASERGGTVKLNVRGDRVLLKGQAVMISKVELIH